VGADVIRFTRGLSASLPFLIGALLALRWVLR